MRCSRLVGTVVLLGLTPAIVRASCNVIPSAERSFPSTLGSVSTPFARPAQEVVVTRDASVFSVDPARNRITLSFAPPGGTAVQLDVPSLL